MNKPQPPIIETPRLILRPFTMADAAAVVRFGSNNRTQELTGDIGIYTIEKAQEIIQEVWLKEYEQYGYARMAVVVKSSNELIGFSGLKHLPELSAPDLGYRFLPDYWGQGIATEAAKAILDWGFKNFDFEKIVAFSFAFNFGSMGVLRKLGFNYLKHDHYPGEQNGITLNWYELQRMNYEEK
ncbi:MAG: GNAT family N-acetyltransferase [Bacteroidetes bacterium]|nr:GNAT family N-acetyltransferase [Bacteroidota bacterium]